MQVPGILPGGWHLEETLSWMQVSKVYQVLAVACIQHSHKVLHFSVGMQLDLVLSEDQKKERFKVSIEKKSRGLSVASTSRVTTPPDSPHSEVEHASPVSPITSGRSQLPIGQTSSNSTQESPYSTPRILCSTPETLPHWVQPQTTYSLGFPFISRSPSSAVKQEYTPSLVLQNQSMMGGY